MHRVRSLNAVSDRYNSEPVVQELPLEISFATRRLDRDGWLQDSKVDGNRSVACRRVRFHVPVGLATAQFANQTAASRLRLEKPVPPFALTSRNGPGALRGAGERALPWTKTEKVGWQSAMGDCRAIHPMNRPLRPCGRLWMAPARYFFSRYGLAQIQNL